VRSAVKTKNKKQKTKNKKQKTKNKKQKTKNKKQKTKKKFSGFRDFLSEGWVVIRLLSQNMSF
jgi:hypothetical protein